MRKNFKRFLKVKLNIYRFCLIINVDYIVIKSRKIERRGRRGELRGGRGGEKGRGGGGKEGRGGKDRIELPSIIARWAPSLNPPPMAGAK